MTDDVVNLRVVLEKSPGADLPREMIGLVDGGIPFQLGTPPPTFVPTSRWAIPARRAHRCLVVQKP